jgi:hypothetical protein
LSRFLALDWDHQQLHVVAAEVRGGVVTFRRAAVWREEQSPTLAGAEDAGRLLKQRLKEAGIAAAPVLACVGRDRVVLKEVRYPVVSDSEEPAIVRFQALKELTEPPDEIVLDFAPIGDSGGERRASVLSVRRDLLTAYQKLCQAAGLKLVGLMPRSFALAAAAAPPAVPADVPVGVVATGDGWAEFAVVRGGNLLLARPVAPGSGLPAEVRRNLSVFAGQHPALRIDSVYLAGSGDNALARRLSEALELPVNSFDPFGGASGEMLPSGDRGSFIGAAGILLAKAKSPVLPINFVQPRQPAPPKRINVRMTAAIAVAVVLLLGGGVAAARSVLNAKAAEKEDKLAQSEDKERQAAALREIKRHIQPLDSWEQPVWLDELYELSARVHDIDSLTVTQFSAEPVSHTGNNAKSRYSAIVRLRGTLRNNDRAPFNNLMDELRKDGHYSVENPKVLNGNQFELTVYVERRSPEEYKQHRLAGGLGR